MTIVKLIRESYIIPMMLKTGGLLDILEIAMNTCCKSHDLCRNCLHLDSCVRLWDKASEQSITKDFDSEHLRNYIDEFNQFWENDEDTAAVSSDYN